MRRLALVLAATLLLTACAAMRQGGGEAAYDCRRAVNVPDKAFRGLLLERGYATKAGGHWMRPTPEGCALTALECYGMDIHSLRGIEMFPQLEEVVCSDNPITELDLSVLPRLERLYALDVPLRRFVVGQCSRLRRVQLSHTALDTLDLATMPDLELLLCIFSPLTAIDITPCQQLTTLYIRGTQITEVDLSGNPAMHELHALDTPLQTILVTPAQYDGGVRASVSDSVQVIVGKAG
ncbi:MAG: hypothetical protein IKN29_08990 [Bacteroidales bacterium]|nr:hypothetical protein [Bacteroidales bacterium]